MPQTWLIIGASRGIGLEFVSQLLSHGDLVIATSRSPAPTSSNLPTNQPIFPPSTSLLWPLMNGPHGKNLTILECDVVDEVSVDKFVVRIRELSGEGGVLWRRSDNERGRGVIDIVVLNAGILEYPGRICDISSSSFIHHLQTNTIGPLLTASKLLALSHLPSPSPHPSQRQSTTKIHTLVFISSDSGSASVFRFYEDGFGAYSVSKAALNQGLRHLAAELHLKSKNASVSYTIQQDNNEERPPVILALHPGEVKTDMAKNVELPWEVEGVIGVEESVKGMLGVIREKGLGGTDEGGWKSAGVEGREREDGEASFWTWRGERYAW